jgi:hypothetical protein
MERNNLKHLSSGENTYWPSDWNKLPDLVDLWVTKVISQDFAVALSSDHSPVLITLTSHALNKEQQPTLSNRHTNWDDFRHLIKQRLNLNVSHKPKKILKLQSSSSTIQYSGQVGKQHQNVQTHSRHKTALYYLYSRWMHPVVYVSNK